MAKNNCIVFTKLLKLVGNILFIPTNNTYVERIFSIMGKTWTDNQNKMGIELVKTELYYKSMCKPYLHIDYFFFLVCKVN